MAVSILPSWGAGQGFLAIPTPPGGRMKDKQAPTKRNYKRLERNIDSVLSRDASRGQVLVLTGRRVLSQEKELSGFFCRCLAKESASW